MDIAAIILLTIAAIPVVSFTEGLPRVILGVIVLLVFPGYSTIAALFPAKKSLGGIERAGLSIVLSLAIVSLTDLILNHYQLGIRTAPIVISTVVIVVVSSGIALLRRSRLDEKERFSPRIHISFPRWNDLSKLDRALDIALAVVLLTSATVLAYVIARPKAEQAFTNFYVLGPQGKMEDYPIQLTINDDARVTLGITNHENHSARYKVDVKMDGRIVQTMDVIELADAGDWSRSVTLTPSRIGDHQEIEFLLYIDSGSDPYLNLRLWLDVK